MKIKAILAALLISATFISCDDEGDVTKPVIELTSPAEGDVISVASASVSGLHFEVDFSDDVALASYKVNIHSEEGHTHSSSVTRSDDDEWEYNQTWYDIDGLKSSHVHHHEIIIDTPEEHYGEYHFMVYCVDQAGNQSYISKNVTIGE